MEGQHIFTELLVRASHGRWSRPHNCKGLRAVQHLTTACILHFQPSKDFTGHSEDALIAAMTLCREARPLIMSAPCESSELQTS